MLLRHHPGKAVRFDGIYQGRSPWLVSIPSCLARGPKQRDTRTDNLEGEQRSWNKPGPRTCSNMGQARTEPGRVELHRNHPSEDYAPRDWIRRDRHESHLRFFEGAGLPPLVRFL